jgi:hypothetical protein
MRPTEGNNARHVQCILQTFYRTLAKLDGVDLVSLLAKPAAKRCGT